MNTERFKPKAHSLSVSLHTEAGQTRICAGCARRGDFGPDPGGRQ